LPKSHNTNIRTLPIAYWCASSGGRKSDKEAIHVMRTIFVKNVHKNIMKRKVQENCFGQGKNERKEKGTAQGRERKETKERRKK